MSYFVALEECARMFWIAGWRHGSEYEMAEIHLKLGSKQ
jgi:hypothetical protein